MRRFTLPFAALLLMGMLGCSDDTNTNQDGGSADVSTLKRYGQACAKDGDCDTGICLNKICTVKCTKQAECPSVGKDHFDCGEAATGVVACYARAYDTAKMGKDCSTDGKCDTGYICTGLDGDAGRKCVGECTTDRDCPPKYRCATTITGKTADAKKYCRERLFCHPCIIDDQCGSHLDKCIKDGNGNKFCSKACNPTSTANDAGLSGTCPFVAKCTKEGSGYQCQHKSGSCYKSFKGEGAQCAPCIVHGSKNTGVGYKDPWSTIAEAGQCKTGSYCVQFNRFQKEAACLEPCTGTCSSTAYYCKAYLTSLGGSFCLPVTSQGSLDTCFK